MGVIKNYIRQNVRRIGVVPVYPDNKSCSIDNSTDKVNEIKEGAKLGKNKGPFRSYKGYAPSHHLPLKRKFVLKQPNATRVLFSNASSFSAREIRSKDETANDERVSNNKVIDETNVSLCQSNNEMNEHVSRPNKSSHDSDDAFLLEQRDNIFGLEKADSTDIDLENETQTGPRDTNTLNAVHNKVGRKVKITSTKDDQTSVKDAGLKLSPQVTENGVRTESEAAINQPNASQIFVAPAPLVIESRSREEIYDINEKSYERNKLSPPSDTEVVKHMSLPSFNDVKQENSETVSVIENIERHGFALENIGSRVIDLKNETQTEACDTNTRNECVNVMTQKANSTLNINAKTSEAIVTSQGSEKCFPIVPTIVVDNQKPLINMASPSCVVNVSELQERTPGYICANNDTAEGKINYFTQQSNTEGNKHVSLSKVNDLRQEKKDATSFYKNNDEMLLERYQRMLREYDQNHAVGKASAANSEHSYDAPDYLRPRQEKSQIVTKFLNEFYEKKLDLSIKFSDQEIKDVRSAVIQLVISLAHTIGKIDSRLFIQDVFPVGSAREGTQIIRPCEYDFILVLKTLSKPGAVSLEPADKDDESRAFVHVKLEDADVRSAFQQCSENDYLRGSHWLTCFRLGLREVFSSAVYKAICLHSSYTIEMNTGKLKVVPTNPESHGPAFMIRLVWERTTKNRAEMEISVDLCSALRVDIETHKNALPEVVSHCLYKLGTDERVETAFLMPREGHLFKVTFTDVELLYTFYLTQHHRQCYKLLKNLVNGEPFPRERHTNWLLKPFMDSKTVFHSYALKTKVWEHQYTLGCNEEEDLNSCITAILKEFDDDNEMLPFSKRTPNKSPVVAPVDGSDDDNGNICEFFRISKEKLSSSRVHSLLKGLEKIDKTDIDKYNFEAFCRVVKPRGLQKCPAKTGAKIIGFFISLGLIVNAIIVVSYNNEELASNRKVMFAIGAALFLCIMIIIFFSPLMLFVKRRVLALRSVKCTVKDFNCLVLLICVILYIVGVSLLMGSAYGVEGKLSIFGITFFLAVPCMICQYCPRHWCKSRK